jgi:hypothetical protein
LLIFGNLWIQELLKITKVLQTSWTFEFLPEPLKIPREYNCSKVSQKAREIQIETKPNSKTTVEKDH